VLTPPVISFYSSTIFQNVGYSAEQALYASLGYGAIQVVFTIPTLFLIDPVGRRRLCLIVSIGQSETDGRLSHSCVFSCWLLVYRCSTTREVRQLRSVLLSFSSTCLQLPTRSVKVPSLSSTRPRCSLPFRENKAWPGSSVSTTLLVCASQEVRLTVSRYPGLDFPPNANRNDSDWCL